MLNFARKHPYIVGCLIAFLILFLIGVLTLNTSWSEALFGSAVLSAIGTGAVWWKQEGFG
jgi:hypothetical protein